MRCHGGNHSFHLFYLFFHVYMRGTLHSNILIIKYEATGALIQIYFSLLCLDWSTNTVTDIWHTLFVCLICLLVGGVYPGVWPYSAVHTSSISVLRLSPWHDWQQPRHPPAMKWSNWSARNVKTFLQITQKTCFLERYRSQFNLRW